MGVEFNTKQFNEAVSKVPQKVKDAMSQAIKISCEKIRSTSLQDMAKTPRNPTVSHYTNNKKIPHHPSLPGNAPAPDTGNLRSSIHYTIEKDGNLIIGRVGTDVIYGKYLEFGTSSVAPRPWLKPAMDKNEQFIHKTINEFVSRSLKK